MNTQLDISFSSKVEEFVNELRSLEKKIPPDALPKKNRYFFRIHEAMKRSNDGCRDMENFIGNKSNLLKEIQEGFRQTILPWFDQRKKSSYICFKHRFRTVSRVS